MKFQKPDFNPRIMPPKLKVLTLEVEKFDNNFAGVCYKNGRRYVIDGAIPGDVVKAAAVESFNNITYCGLLAVVKPSEKRVRPKCRYYDSCGGCDFMAVGLKDELAFKTDYVKRRLFPFGTEVRDAVGEKDFRNKITLAFEKTNGKLNVGFIDDKTKKVTDVSECLMHEAVFSDLVKALRFWMEDNDVSIYVPRFGTGMLRFAVARYLDGQLLLTVVGTKSLPSTEDLYKKLKKRFPKVGLFENVNAEKTNEAVVGDVKHLYGEKFIESEMLGIKFRLGPDSFFQTNAAVCGKIYEDALEIVKGKNPSVVYDMYSGIGITSALFSRVAKKVVSVEIVKKAARAQKELLSENGISNVEVIEGDTEEALKNVAVEKGGVFFVDPPRRGLSGATEEILRFEPKAVLYLSCNPDTLVKDVEKFVAAGYKAVSATPYNMFRATTHVEIMVLLEKTENDE